MFQLKVCIIGHQDKEHCHSLMRVALLSLYSFLDLLYSILAARESFLRYLDLGEFLQRRYQVLCLRHLHSLNRFKIHVPILALDDEATGS